MIASKKVKREECTLDDFLTELFDNKNHRFGEKLRLKIFQKNELIRNLRLENDDYRTLWENQKFENKELNLKNAKITRKFEHSIKLLKKERLSNEFLSKQLDSYKEKNWDKPIIDEIEALLSERTEEPAPFIHNLNNASQLTITEVHSEIQSDDEDDHQDIFTRQRTREPEVASFQADVIDVSEDEETIDEGDGKAIDNFSFSADDTEDQLEEDVITLQESETNVSGLNNPDDISVDDLNGSLSANLIYDQLEDDEDDQLEDTFISSESHETDINGEEETGDVEMDLADSTDSDITEENNSAGMLSFEESLGQDVNTLNNSEDISEDVSNTPGDDSQIQERLTEVVDEDSEKTEDANEPARVKEPESCSSVSVPPQSASRNITSKVRKRRLACGHCDPCTIEDCGNCSNCLDKPKFGGLGKKKQKCMLRKCQNPS